MTRRARSIATVTAALVLAACSVDANDPIVGRWRVRDGDCQGSLARLHFAPSGRLTTFVRIAEPGMPLGLASPRPAPGARSSGRVAPESAFDIMRQVPGCPNSIEVPTGLSKYSTLHVLSRNVVFARFPRGRVAYYRRDGDTLRFGYRSDLSDGRTYVPDTSGVESPFELFDRVPRPRRF